MNFRIEVNNSKTIEIQVLITLWVVSKTIECICGMLMKLFERTQEPGSQFVQQSQRVAGGNLRQAIGITNGSTAPGRLQGAGNVIKPNGSRSHYGAKWEVGRVLHYLHIRLIMNLPLWLVVQHLIDDTWPILWLFELFLELLRWARWMSVVIGVDIHFVPFIEL